jgi:molybdopterin-guanine dinucleotide biosynthesis protein A
MRARAPRSEITAVILAGGEGRRMGGRDKGWVEVDGRPLIAQVLEHVAPQVGGILISANREHARYAALGHAVISDDTPGFHGPLAGIVTALARVATSWLVTVPVDARAPAPDLVERLWQGAVARDARIAVAHDGQHEQPLFAI